MIGYLAFAAFAVSALAFLFSVEAGILVAIVAHPISAAAWYQAFFIGPVWINPVGAVGIAMTFGILAWGLTRGPSILRIPLAGYWITYIVYYTFASSIHALNYGAAASVDLMIRHLAGLTGFYMGQAYFLSHDRFRQFTMALIISGIFPIGVILYQVASGGGTLREMSEGGELRIEMTAGLERLSGFYHDIVPVRGYAYQCLIGILLYWCYFIRPKGDTVKKAALIALGVATLFVVYKMYSKAAILTMLCWFIIWSVGFKRYGLGIFISLAFIGVNLLHSDAIFSETSRLFETEITSIATEGAGVDDRYLLAGRVGLWQYNLARFFEASAIEQIFGIRAAKGAHNDYLQKLLSGGVIGLCIYVVLLARLGLAVGMLNLRERSPINLAAGMIFCGWMIDSIGVVPSVYPAYQWYAWSLVGIAIRGLDFEKSGQPAAAAPRPTGPIWLRDGPPQPPPVPSRRLLRRR